MTAYFTTSFHFPPSFASIESGTGYVREALGNSTNTPRQGVPSPLTCIL